MHGRPLNEIAPAPLPPSQGQLDLPSRRSGSPMAHIAQPPDSDTDRLPKELWSEIFLFALDISRLGPLQVILQPADSPVLPISQTCQSWREISHSFPALWTDLSFTENQCRDELYQKHVLTWIGRARSLPISIQYLANTSTEESSTGLTYLLLPNVKQTRRLHLVISSDYLKSLSRLDPDDLSILEDLSIHCFLPKSFTQPRGTLTGFVLPFQKAPVLRTFECNIPRLSSIRSISLLERNLISVCWSRLTELSILDRVVEASSMREIFILCSSLVKCKLTIRGWHPNEVVPESPPSTHPYLRSLSITVKFGTFHRFFDAMELPALEKLKFANPMGNSFPDSNIVLCIVDLLSRSECQLRTLCLFNAANNSTDDYITLFSRLPLLRTLEARYCSCFDYKMLFWMDFFTPKPLVPSLTTLIIEDDFEDIDHGQLIHMLKSRWWLYENGVPTKRWGWLARIVVVQITCDSLQNLTRPKLLDRIRALQKQGLKLDYNSI